MKNFCAELVVLLALSLCAAAPARKDFDVVVGQKALVASCVITDSATKQKAAARLVVLAPADVVLHVEGVVMAARNFRTPPLEPGREYFYEVEARSPRGSISRRIHVRAGETTTLTLSYQRKK